LTADSTCSKDDEEEKAHLSFTSETTDIRIDSTRFGGAAKANKDAK
jgi:hypothetical protein